MKKGIILLAVLIAATAAMTGCGANNNSAQTTTAPATVAATTSGELTEAEAKAAALKDANIPEAEATFVKAVKKTEDGFTYYEIEFTTSTKKYTYKIVATNGTVKDKKVESYSGDASSGSKITEAEAKAAALEIAELSESDVTDLKAVLTTENGVSVYKVEFKTDDEEFEYLINASTGELYEAETENDSDDSDSDDNDSDDNDSDDGDYSDEDNGDTDDSDDDTDSNDSNENNNENNNE